MSFTVKGDNTEGTSAWYEFNVADGAGLSCPANISLSGSTGDTFSLWDSNPPASSTLLASKVRKVSGVSLPPGTGIMLDVSGGTRGAQFTLTITPT